MVSSSWRSSPRLIGLTAYVATFVDGSLHGFVVPILPYSLVDRYNVAEQDVEFWLASMLAIFGVANAVCSPLAGWFCARSRSTKGPYFVAQALALAGTLVMCFSRTVWMLLLARALQGASASIIYISTIGMIIELLDKSTRGAWIGIAFSGLSMSLVVSPSAGGALYDGGGYFAIFYVIFGMIGLAMILRLLIADSPRRHIDESEYARISQSQRAFGGAQQTSPLRARDQASRTSHRFVGQFPVMALVLGSGRLRAALFGGFIHTAIITSFDTILPIMVKRTFHWSTSSAGTTFLALAAPSLLSGVAGAISDRVGPRRTALCGFTLTICGLLPLVMIESDRSFEKLLLYGLLALVGLGLTLVLSPLAADVASESDQLAAQHPEVFKGGAFSQTFAAFNVGLGIAAALGPILAGVLYRKLDWGFTMLVLAVLCGFAGMFISRFTGGVGYTAGHSNEVELELVRDKV